MDKDDEQLKQWAEEHPVLLNVFVIGTVILLLISLNMVIRDEQLRGEFVRGSPLVSPDSVCDCRCSGQVTEENQE